MKEKKRETEKINWANNWLHIYSKVRGQERERERKREKERERERKWGKERERERREKEREYYPYPWLWHKIITRNYDLVYYDTKVNNL